MPLSEHEQRQIEKIERALAAEDPLLASRMAGFGTRQRRMFRRPSPGPIRKLVPTVMLKPPTLTKLKVPALKAHGGLKTFLRGTKKDMYFGSAFFALITGVFMLIVYSVGHSYPVTDEQIEMHAALAFVVVFVGAMIICRTLFGRRDNPRGLKDALYATLIVMATAVVAVAAYIGIYFLP